MWDYIISPICYANRHISHYIKNNVKIPDIYKIGQNIFPEIYTCGKVVLNIMKGIEI